MAGRKFRTVGIWGIALLLAGCQPTTDVVIVTPKSAIAGAKMVDEGTVGNVAEQVQAPKTCTLSMTNLQENLQMNVNADIIVPEADGIRLKKVETRVFDQKDMDHLKEKLLQGQSLWRREYTQEEKDTGIALTQDEIQKGLERLEELQVEDRLDREKEGYGQDLEYWESERNYWEELEKDAPENYRKKEVSTKVSYNRAEAERFVSEDGGYGENSNMVKGAVTVEGQDYDFILNNNWCSDNKSIWVQYKKTNFGDYGDYSDIYAAEAPYVTGTGNYDDAAAALMSDFAVPEEAETTGMYDTAVQVKTPKEELKAKGDALVKTLGFEDMQVAAYTNCVRTVTPPVENQSGVGLVYTRVLDGIPVTYTDYRYAYDEKQVNYAETFELVYDDEGLVQMIWRNPARIYDMSDEYVFLLPFSDILKIFKEEALGVNEEESQDEGWVLQKRIQINEIRLGYMWVPDTATEMEGMLIPVWDFMGTQVMFWPGDEEKGTDSDWSENQSPYQSFLTINAMDGSIVKEALKPY